MRRARAPDTKGRTDNLLGGVAAGVGDLVRDRARFFELLAEHVGTGHTLQLESGELIGALPVDEDENGRG